MADLNDIFAQRGKLPLSLANNLLPNDPTHTWHDIDDANGLTVASVFAWDTKERNKQVAQRIADLINAFGLSGPLLPHRVIEVAHNLVANAKVIPDPQMGGETDCVAIPLDDFDALKAALTPPEPPHA